MTSAIEIETIVRRVLQRMLSGQLAPVTSPIEATSTTTLCLDASLVTLSALPQDLDGFTQLQVPYKAVVTPAVRDILRARKIGIVRTDAPSKANAQSPTFLPEAVQANVSSAVNGKKSQEIIIAGNAAWYRSLSRSLCPKRTMVTESSHDDATALRALSVGLRDGHRAGVLVADSAHAACWQAARDEKMRPVVIHDWAESKQIFYEVPTNLVIVCNRRWNAPSTANLVRTWLRHLKDS